MSISVYWFLPGHGDGRDVARQSGSQGRPASVRRAPEPGYLSQVAQACDGLGYTGALVPVGMFCEDPWLVSAALAAATSRLNFMVAVRPGPASPLAVAQQVATLQRITGGRVMLNVVTGGDPDELHRYGDWTEHSARYQRTGEFLKILRGLWTGDPVDHEGDHYRLRAAVLTRPYHQAPPVFVGGSSAAAQQAAAEHADVYLAWGEPPAGMTELVSQASATAARVSRAVLGAGGSSPAGIAPRTADRTGLGPMAMGTRLHVISRDRAEDAWAVADRLLDGMEQHTIDAALQRFSRSESVGQRRAAALQDGARNGLEVHPNVWIGYGLVRPGAGITLVGSHEQVADRLSEYHDLGMGHVILSGQPHLEEAYAFGEGVLPLLRDRGVLADPAAPPVLATSTAPARAEVLAS